MEDINEMIAGGNLVVALALLTEKLTKEPENVEALKLRGELLLRMGDKQGAQEDARRLICIRKISQTSTKYPRNSSQIKAKPLI